MTTPPELDDHRPPDTRWRRSLWVRAMVWSPLGGIVVWGAMGVVLTAGWAVLAGGFLWHDGPLSGVFLMAFLGIGVGPVATAIGWGVSRAGQQSPDAGADRFGWGVGVVHAVVASAFAAWVVQADLRVLAVIPLFIVVAMWSQALLLRPVHDSALVRWSSGRP